MRAFHSPSAPAETVSASSSAQGPAPFPRPGLGLLFGVLGASVVVAVASGSTGLLRAPAALTAGGAFALRVVGALMLLGGVLALRRQSRTTTATGRRGPDLSAPALLRAGLLMAALAIVAGLTAPPRVASGPGERGAAPNASSRPARPGEIGSVPAPPERTPPPLAETREGGRGEGAPMPLPSIRPERAAVDDAQTREPSVWAARARRAILGLLLLVALTLIVRGQMRPKRWRKTFSLDAPSFEAPPPVVEPLPPFTREGRTPREQVTLAYRHLLAALAGVGAPRAFEEAPFEHVRRAVRILGTAGGAMLRLTGLYVLAQFSDRPLDERHGEQAAQALHDSLEAIEARPRRPRRRETDHRDGKRTVRGLLLAEAGERARRG